MNPFKAAFLLTFGIAALAELAFLGTMYYIPEFENLVLRFANNVHVAPWTLFIVPMLTGFSPQLLLAKYRNPRAVFGSFLGFVASVLVLGLIGALLVLWTLRNDQFFPRL